MARYGIYIRIAFVEFQLDQRCWPFTRINLLAVLMLLTVTPLISGCSTLTGIDSRYPPQWQETTKTIKTCRSFEGEYQNLAIANYTATDAPSLLAYWFGFPYDTTTELEKINSVRITCIPDDILLIEAIAEGAVVHSRQMAQSYDTWNIVNDLMVFPNLNNSAVESLGVVLQYEALSLNIAANGALIGKKKRWNAALAFWVIPMFGSQTFWFNWARLQ